MYLLSVSRSGTELGGLILCLSFPKANWTNTRQGGPANICSAPPPSWNRSLMINRQAEWQNFIFWCLSAHVEELQLNWILSWCQAECGSDLKVLWQLSVQFYFTFWHQLLFRIIPLLRLMESVMQYYLSYKYQLLWRVKLWVSMTAQNTEHWIKLWQITPTLQFKLNWNQESAAFVFINQWN